MESVLSELEPLRPGRVIGAKYQLVRPLGAGGMGVVWYAKHLELDAPVAIKLLTTSEHASTKAVDTFLHEAMTAASVHHRNVASATDFGTDVDGQPFMVMEMLEGASLAERFELGARLPVAELVDVMAQCLSGLAAVHAAGILHRDLKPENVFLVSDGDAVYPKLIDFGISRSLRDTPGVLPGGKRRGAMLTTDGAMMGTPHYMSPEQAGGLEDVDQRADLYAIGVILYEGLAGRAPYDQQNILELLGAIVHGGAPSLVDVRPDVGAALSEVVAKAMAPRESRYCDAREMRAALLAATTLPGSTPHGSVFPPPRPDLPTLDAARLPTYLRRATVVTALLCLLVLGLGVGLWAMLDAGSVDAAARPTVTAGAPRHQRPDDRSASLVVPPVRLAEPMAPAPPAVPVPEVRHHVAVPLTTRRGAAGRVNGVFRDPGF